MKALEIDPQQQKISVITYQMDEQGEFAPDFRGKAISLGHEFSNGDFLYYESDGAKDANNLAFIIHGTGEAYFGKAYVLASSKWSPYFSWVNTRLSKKQLAEEILFCSRDETQDLR